MHAARGGACEHANSRSRVKLALLPECPFKSKKPKRKRPRGDQERPQPPYATRQVASAIKPHTQRRRVHARTSSFSQTCPSTARRPGRTALARRPRRSANLRHMAHTSKPAPPRATRAAPALPAARAAMNAIIVASTHASTSSASLSSPRAGCTSSTSGECEDEGSERVSHHDHNRRCLKNATMSGAGKGAR